VTLTGRLTLLFAAVAVTVSAAIGAAGYAATDHSLDTEIRTGLDSNAAALGGGQVPDELAGPVQDGDGDLDSTAAGTTPRPPTTFLLAQLLDAIGTASAVGNRPVELPVNAGDRALAASPAEHDSAYRVVDVAGVRYLMLTEARGHGRGAVQVARSLTDRDAVLARLAVAILLIAAVVAAAAAIAGRFIATALTRRLVRLTAVAEQVSATGRVDVGVPTGGRDEVGRLGAAFDSMLGRLARSKDDQQRLVQNAGHELRTPLTSIRTNVSLLRRADELSAAERAEILDDLAGESRELTELVNELVELATDRRADEPESDANLVALAERVAERTRRRTGREVTVDADPPGLAVRGRPLALERALANLVDNAVKFDHVVDREAEHPVEIVLRTGRVEVRDRGPGVPAEDVEKIFDRFHRATSVRSLPGSGLGLSIVKDVVSEHGGQVFALERDGGGAVIGFTLPAERFTTGSNPG
jgi:two-component system sensor histidine kinase MprB